MTEKLPFLDITATGFSTRSDEVMKAREQSFAARTPYGIAILRHAETGALLRDRRLRQGSHGWPYLQGLEGSFADFWKRSVISQEGKTHRQLRDLAMPALANDFILSLVPNFERAAKELLFAIREDSACEFVASFSEPFAGRAITSLLGLAPEQAHDIARDASALGLAMGVGSKQHEPVFNAACDRLMGLSDKLIERARSGKDRTSYVARLVQRQETLGQTDDQALGDMIVISIFGGVDTTRAQLAFAVALFIENPVEWQKLRSDPLLVPQAIEEIIRTRPTTTWATREALEQFTFEGVKIEKGDILHLFVHAAATDPAVSDGTGFDVSAKRKSHFGFGGGAHHCLGQFVARTDMAAALRVLVKNVRAFHWDGTPEWLPDSGNTSPVALPVRLEFG